MLESEVWGARHWAAHLPSTTRPTPRTSPRGRRVYGNTDGLGRSNGGKLRSHRGAYGRHADCQRGYIYVGPVRIARFAQFCTVCHASPRSFDWFAQPVSVGFPSTPNPKKGLEQVREFPPSPRNVSKPFSGVFARSGNSNLSVIKVFFCAKS